METGYKVKVAERDLVSLISDNMIVTTIGVRKYFTDEDIQRTLERFINLDFGKTCKEDVETNLNCIRYNSGMVMGSYTVRGVDMWIISHLGYGGYTTVLLPEEY